MTRDVNQWLMTFDGYDPSSEGLREALCTVGNGYLATRGALPECVSDGVHHPGTYMAGLYNRLGSDIDGRWVTNESMVNAPNWLPVTVRIGNSDWLGGGRPAQHNESRHNGHELSSALRIVDHQIELDMARGVLTRTSVIADSDDRRLRLTQRRFVSMRHTHLAAIETTVVPIGWSGPLSVRVAIDGRVRNNGVDRYEDLPDLHLGMVATHHENDSIMCLHAETSSSRILISEASRTAVWVGGEPHPHAPVRLTDHRWVAQQFDLEASDGEQVRVEKLVWIFTSRDDGIADPRTEACHWACATPGGFEDLLASHVVAWRHLWGRVSLHTGAPNTVGRYINAHLFHVLQTMSPATVFVDAGVPARGLHGEAYRGHVFWDELFVLPSLSLRVPEVARSALLYRYRRLDMARLLARTEGFCGAMFPWQSGANGGEETQTMHLNPVSGRWLPDASHLQRHVNAAVAYNVWQYYQATGDVGFLAHFGGEMMLEIARFWASAASYNHALDRFEILGVMGPDEYHEAYTTEARPDTDGTPGLDNNAYTNVMAVWCLVRAFEVLEVLPPAAVAELADRIGLDDTELDHWAQVSRKMRVCFHDGVISQFEDYEKLVELDWETYRQRYGDIHRLDRILEAEGDTPNRYRLTKQADVMMLFFALSADELAELLERLGYDYDPGLIPRTIKYYEPRTAHGSTLSRVVHAWVHARADRAKSFRLFCEALHSDIDDIQGGTTAEGIHLGAMAGTIDVLQRCYTGLELTHDVMRLNPVLPPELAPLSFSVRYRGHLIHLVVGTTQTTVRMDNDEGAPVVVEFNRQRHDLAPGHTVTLTTV